MNKRDLEETVAKLKEENSRIRVQLAKARAMSTAGATDFLIVDAVNTEVSTMQCRYPSVSGRVTVVIPAYNAEAFIARAVRSVWSQTLDLKKIELLVIDDGSSDRTLSICHRLAKKSPVRMRVLTHDGGCNLGVSATRQLGCTEATGEYIALLDADDLYLPGRLVDSIKLLNTRMEIPATCSLGVNVDMKGHPIIGHNGTTVAGDWASLGKGLHPPFSFDQLWNADPIANSSVTIRRSAMEIVGGYPHLMAHQAEDWLIVLKLSLLSPIPCIDKKLIHYTHHDQAYTTGYNKDGLHEGARIEVFYHLVWWMLRSATYAEKGATFFRQMYPRLIADHQRLLPILRDYVALGGHVIEGLSGFETYVNQLYEESMALRRVLNVKLKENNMLRTLLEDGPEYVDSRVYWLYTELEALRRVVKNKMEENRKLRVALFNSSSIGSMYG